MEVHLVAFAIAYAQGDVEKVALWAGLVASIVGIVLSIVAIVFAVLGSLRLEKVTDATIRSLQKLSPTLVTSMSRPRGCLRPDGKKC